MMSCPPEDMDDVGEDNASRESEANLEDPEKDVSLVQHAELSPRLFVRRH